MPFLQNYGIAVQKISFFSAAPLNMKKQEYIKMFSNFKEKSSMATTQVWQERCRKFTFEDAKSAE